MSRHELRLILSPYHDGLERVDRGRGPDRLVEALDGSGVAASLRRPVSVEVVPPPDAASPEAARLFALNRRLATRVRSAVADGAFPLVLAGDCNSCLGTVAGCGIDGLGVVWFDAHADFDSPEESRSGSLDEMGLAILTGRGWQALREAALGLAPLAEDAVVLAGVRDVSSEQRDRLRRSRVRVLAGNGFSEADVSAALAHLALRTRRVYLHVDLDALDPGEGIANRYSAPDGLNSAQLLSMIGRLFDRFDVAAAALTAYDPDSDTDGRMATTATRVLAAVAERALRDNEATSQTPRRPVG